jgi:molybdopterin converting factor small subunit
MAGEVAVTVALRGVLRQHADGRSEVEVTVPTGASVREVLDRLADDLPAVERRVRDETGHCAGTSTCSSMPPTCATSAAWTIE